MKKTAFLKYLDYILEHKINVFIEGRKLNVGLGQLLKHDLSKFSRHEWKPYLHKFFDKRCSQCLSFGVKQQVCSKKLHNKNNDCNEFSRDKNHPVEKAFKVAFLHHQRKNKHHWQYWVKTDDKGKQVPQEMPIKYVKEMLADWNAMSRKFQDKNNVRKSSAEFFRKSKKTLLHPATLKVVKHYFETGKI